MHKSTVGRVLATLARFRADHNMKSELKWCKVSNQKLAEYEALVDIFFALNNVNHIQFHGVVFDSHNWNHRRYNNGERDVGVSKLYYQLLLHKFVSKCGPAGTLYARLDHRNSSTSLEDLRRMLNAAAARDFGLTENPLKQLVSEDSKNCDLLQVNDVILGAVCAARNGRHLLPGTRLAKQKIASLVLAKSGLRSFEVDTPKTITRFTMWNMRAQPR